MGELQNRRYVRSWIGALAAAFRTSPRACRQLDFATYVSPEYAMIRPFAVIGMMDRLFSDGSFLDYEHSLNRLTNLGLSVPPSA